MATILDRNAFRWSSLTKGQAHLWEAKHEIDEFNAFADGGATDAEIEAVYGIPAIEVSAAKTLMTNVATALETASVTNFLSKMA